MMRELKLLWEKYGFEIVLVSCVLFIIILALIRRGKKGTWTEKYNIKYTSSNSSAKPRTPVLSKGEAECRRVLESIFNKPFNKARPDFLKNPVTIGFNLELDCYNPELKLAVEYNGIQHYQYKPYFHRTKEVFHNQKYRDYIKRDLCSKNNITLIEVPYSVKNENIEQFLIENLRKYGYIN